MKLGLPTFIECKNLKEHFDIAKELKLDFVEVNMTFPQYNPFDLNIEEINRARDNYGIFITIHADEQLNPFDFNPKVSECYFEVMRDTIRFAKVTSARLINMHLSRGIYATLPDGPVYLYDVYREEYLSRVRAFIVMCEEEIGDAPIKIAIENTNGFTESQREAIDLFMKSDKFGLTLDTGHELCVSFADAPVFNAYPEKLIHMHLHDAVGRRDHLPLGEGQVNVNKKLGLLGESDTCVVEVKKTDGLKRSLSYLKKRDFC